MKNLSKSIIATLAAGLFTCGLFSQHASATLMTGTIGLSGQVQYDTGNVNTADTITQWGNARVEVANGSFGGIAKNTPATFNAPWNFDPSAPLSALWSVSGFTFDLLTSTIVKQGGGVLTLSGTGVITSTNEAFDSTSGTWFFSSQTGSIKNGKFSFTADAGAVPDGGSALALLGIGLVLIETLRRRFAAA